MCAIGSVKGHDNDNWGWQELEVRLPRAVSDHTASISEFGIIYLAGGCDDPLGNVWVPLDDGDGFFACGSISDGFYAFNILTREVETLPNLPRPRYRHSGVYVNNQVWLIGGRTLEDDLIPEVDVFDVATQQWTTVDLPMEYVVSDHAGFGEDPAYVYIVGGYNGEYTALDQVARIDARTLVNGNFTIENRTPMNTPRGDIIGVTSSDGEAAFISGGFTHDNEFCAPLSSTEKLTFAGGTWENLPDLMNGRGEVVLVELDDHLYALGGERQIEGVCELRGSLDPGELTVGTDEVESYDNGEWKIISDFPQKRFRFAAVAGQDGLIYTFGGQTEFDQSCQCFQTTDEIYVFGEGIEDKSGAFLPFPYKVWLTIFATSSISALSLLL